MPASTSRSQNERRTSSAQSVPNIGRSLSRPYGRRHPKGVSIIRYLVAIWLVCLGTVFCALGQWWGALFFPAALGIGALAYFMPRWNRALAAEGDA